MGLQTLATALEEFLKGAVLEKNRRALQRGFDELILSERKEGKPPVAAKKTSPKSSGISFQSRYPAAWASGAKPLILPTGEWRSLAPLLDPKTCRQCGWCSVYCPLGCMKPGDDGYFHPDLNYCKGCGICAHECPAQAIRMVAEEVSES